jgi:hypothetical protein
VQIAIAVSSGQCIHTLCNTLMVWERDGLYFEYVEFLHRMLIKSIRSPDRMEVDERMFRQLIAVAIVFCTNYTEVRARTHGAAVCVSINLSLRCCTLRELTARLCGASAGGEVLQGSRHAAARRGAAHRLR